MQNRVVGTMFSLFEYSVASAGSKSTALSMTQC
jgi:hypothetical protein